MHRLRIAFVSLVLSFFIYPNFATSQELPTLKKIQLPIPIAYGTKPILDGQNFLYLSVNNTLVSLYKETMDFRWETNNFDGIDRPLQPVVTKKQILFLTNAGILYHINKSTGEIVYQDLITEYGPFDHVLDHDSKMVYIFSRYNAYVIEDKAIPESEQFPIPCPVLPVDIPLGNDSKANSPVSPQNMSNE